MIDVTGDLWTYPADVRVITTNGAVRKDGFAVMGRGCAKEAAERFCDLQELLGAEISKHGNHVHHFFCPTGRIIGHYEHIVTFPVKHHWREQADMDLIWQSTKELLDLAGNTYLGESWKTIVMPRPGCGNGRLSWDDVRSLLAHVLDNRFHVITYEE